MIELGGIIKAAISFAVFAGIIGVMYVGFKNTSKDKKNGGSNSSNNSSRNNSNTGGSAK